MWVLIVGVRWNWLRLLLTSFYLVLSRFLNTKSQVLRKRAGWTLDCWPLLMLRYTADDLWAFRRDDVTPPRRARKTIFKHRLWQPRGQREYQARRLRRSEFSHSTLIDRTTTGIRVDLLNVRSVAKRSIAISVIITSRCLDGFALTESWHRASDDLSLKRCAPPGYSIVGRPSCGSNFSISYWLCWSSLQQSTTVSVW